MTGQQLPVPGPGGQEHRGLHRRGREHQLRHPRLQGPRRGVDPPETGHAAAQGQGGVCKRGALADPPGKFKAGRKGGIGLGRKPGSRCANPTAAGTGGEISPCRSIPPPSRQVLLALHATGKLKYLVSQNVDGIHRRSGFPPAALAELHGNCFLERCPSCGALYERDFEVETVRGRGGRRPLCLCMAGVERRDGGRGDALRGGLRKAGGSPLGAGTTPSHPAGWG